MVARLYNHCRFCFIRNWQAVFQSCCVILQSHQLSSVQFSRSVMSDSLQPRELQHPRPPCPSPAPGAYPNSCPLSQWYHPTISSSVIPFSSCPQYFPASGSFQMSQLFVSGGQSIGVSASTSVLPPFPHTNISKLIHFTPSPPQPLWLKTPFSLVLNYYNRLLTVLAASTLTLPQPHLPW